MDEIRQHLLDAARAFLARGEAKFTIAALCSEAGVSRDDFRSAFSGKAALLAAVMVPQPVESAPPTPDAWLERRLRVFERALNALEAKAEDTAQTQGRAIAGLQEQIALLGLRGGEKPLPVPTPPPDAPGLPAEPKPAPQLLEIAPQPVVTVSKEEMAQVLQDARDRTRAPLAPARPRENIRLRWLAIGCLSLVALFLCIGLSLGKGDVRVAAMQEGSGVSHRQMPPDRVTARADFGDAAAQTVLALRYLKASDSRSAARWSAAAAQDGQPMAQMLLGTLYSQGDGVTRDPVRAAELFAKAAGQGNLKAMHNLAIAYAQGAGVAKDETRAAEWFAAAAVRGYVDSAFDLAVLYERGIGVKQDLKQALKWYGVAALAGDAPARVRVAILRGQLRPDEAQLAWNAARTFAALAPPPQANRLPNF